VTNVIEQNVTAASLAESKTHLAHLVDAAGRCTARALGRSLDDGTAIAVGLFTLLLGVTVALGDPHVEATNGAETQFGEAPIDAYVRLGQWLVSGARRERTAAPRPDR
jgi:hypothetical protein